MIIKNFKSLATDTRKKYALSIIEAGLHASMPIHTLKKIVHRDHLFIKGEKIDLTRYQRVFVIAMGKAAYSMTSAVNALTHIDGGIIVVQNQSKHTIKGNIKTLVAGHPLPNSMSVFAAKKIIGFLCKTKPTDYVIFLISGGASSLVALPDGITLREKQTVTDLLLRCGANIHEINCIRKHISKIKGGKLLDYLRCDAVALIMSDVVGNDLSVVASGMTYFDKTTFKDAKRILQKYNLERSVPKNVLRRIDLGIKSKISETPKSEKIRNFVVSTNQDCLKAMQKRAKGLGFLTKTLGDVSGNVKDIAKSFARLPLPKQSCIIYGGETTVLVKGKGRGGRNQELVLHTIVNLDQHGIVVSSVGTDGIDGNTDCAGAIFESNVEISKVKPFLDDNDSYGFFQKNGGLIFTGSTNTNLMDIGLILRD